MNFIKVSVISLLITLSITGCYTTSSLQSQLPPPREGFHWEIFDEIAVAIESPDGWHRAVSKGSGAYTGSISLEDFNKDGLFKTGFTVQFMNYVKARTGMPPSMLAVTMGQTIKNETDNEIIDVAPLKELGTAKSCFVRYQNSPILGNKITVHKFFVALDSTDRFYIYTFESPNESWDEALEKYGSVMMERINMPMK